jgi:hypothetical protein
MEPPRKPGRFTWLASQRALAEAGRLNKIQSERLDELATIDLN